MRDTVSTLRTLGWGLPSRFVTKLRYTEALSFAQASGTYAEAFYRVIGPYDPKVLAGGDYPAYYDKLLALYQYQRVLRAKITVEFMPEANSFLGCMAEAVLYPTTTAAGVTDLNSAIDKHHSKHCAINFYSAGRWNRLTMKTRPWEELGMRKHEYMSDDTTMSASGQVPGRILYWAVGTQVNDGSTTAAIQARIHIEYTIEFKSLVPLDVVDSAND